MNFLGLLPFVFTLTSHLSFSLSLAYILWLTFILASVRTNLNNFLIHLLPLGRPLILSPFLVLIESVRNLIRPVTLSVRLAANITAGHILLILRSSNYFFVHIFRLPLFRLLLLEIGVSLIQSYVFVILLLIYFSENN